ncbi:hypothetical protein UFOVP228_61 [uncultured Caudovirales phage]|uniref:Portal protein n=1 Tax=uncultured Caudovirales phage TaxID=2100421 RepID=A0A6J7WVZ7_9CAUD|nr:hypothetical protein UFOVP47_41 [uncultured Caudovirales phage]CAB5219363.1 hypothetical protein UFOVP228_61 [uncultured Caudovirales phage]
MFDKSTNQAPQGIADTEEEPIDVEMPELDEEGEVPEAAEVEPAGSDHDDNLAETIPEDVLRKIATDLEAEILMDLASRSDWEKTYKEGVKLLGLKMEERTEPWEGACGVVHPMITEAVVRFQAEMVTETFPAGGPVRTKIIGKETPTKKQAAQRVEEDMNYQLTEVMEEFRSEHERAMWHLPMTGCVFKKVYFDPTLGRQVSLMVAAEEIILPYGTTNIRTTNRMTQFMRKTKIDIERLMASGFYRTVDVQESAGSTTDIQDAKDKATGVEAMNDIRPELYEVIVDLDLSEYDKLAKMVPVAEMDDTFPALDAADIEGSEDDPDHEEDEDEYVPGGDDEGDEDGDEVNEDGGVTVEVDVSAVDPHPQPRSYVLTMVKGTNDVLAIRRNWRKGDPLFLKRQHFVQYDYVPGFGAYGYGLIHLVGGYAKSATSILRQLVDAGTLSNLPGGLKSRGLRIKGEDTPIAPGEFRDVDVGSGPIKDNVMVLPYKEPSVVLSALLDKLIEQGQRFASTADLDIADMGSQAPVGTTLAILERSLKVMSAVQARCHFALKQELKLIAGIIRDEAADDYDFEPEVGVRRARKSDFEMVDIIPVSDPNATTMSQRVIQYQAVMQMMQGAPQVYNVAMVHREMLDVIGIKNAAKLVPLPEDMKPVDPVTENMCLINMKPVKAFIGQDHEAHLAVHQSLLQDPKIQAAIGQNPSAQAIQAALMAHVAEHAAFSYRMQICQQLGMPLPNPDEPMDEQTEHDLAPLLAQAAQQSLAMNQKMAAQQAAQQQMQDPAMMLEMRKLDQKDKEIAQKGEKMKADIAIAADKEDLARQKHEDEYEMQQAELSAQGIRLGHEAATTQMAVNPPPPPAPTPPPIPGAE